MVVKGGSKCQLWYNGVLVQEASGGSGATLSNIAPSGIKYVQVWDGDNTYYRTLSVHYHNHCGLLHPHDWRYSSSRGCRHNDECKCTQDSPLICTRCSHGHDWHYRDMTPDGLPCVNPTTGTYCRFGHYVEVTCTHPGCGMKNGQIIGGGTFSAGQCHFTKEWTPDSVHMDRKGSAMFSIALNEKEGIVYSDAVVHLPYYREGKCNLVLDDDVVTYFKRW